MRQSMYSHASRTPVVNVTRPQQARLPVLLLIVPILILFTQCTSHTPSVNDIQGPPRMTETIQKAPAVPWCEIVRKPSAFDKTVVRTRALLHVDHENQFLYDATCENEPTAPVWVEYDPSYVYSDEGVKRQLTELIKPTRTRSAGTALVTVVGRFAGPPSGPYGHLDGYPSEFSIIRIERAEQGESVAGKLR